MTIDLLEIYIDKDHEIWIADGLLVPKSYLTGKYIVRFVIKEPYDH